MPSSRDRQSPEDQREDIGVSFLTTTPGQRMGSTSVMSSSGMDDRPLGPFNPQYTGGLQSLVLAANASARLHSPFSIEQTNYPEAAALYRPPALGPPIPTETPPVAPPKSSLSTLLEAYRLQNQQEDEGGAATSTLSTSLPPPSLALHSSIEPHRPPEPPSPGGGQPLQGSFSSSSSRSFYSGRLSSSLPGPSTDYGGMGMGAFLEEAYPKHSRDFSDVEGGRRRKHSGEREQLTNLSAEEKLERRKERARMYSHIARKRQENLLKDLKAEVESLNLYRLLIEESPDMIAVLSPDIESRFLFANAAFARLLHTMPSTLLGSSLWDIIHPDDHALVMEVLRSTIMATQSTKSVQCRIKNAYVDKYIPVDVTLRCGRQGIIYFLRLQGDEGAPS